MPSVGGSAVLTVSQGNPGIDPDGVAFAVALTVVVGGIATAIGLRLRRRDLKLSAPAVWVVLTSGLLVAGLGAVARVWWFAIFMVLATCLTTWQFRRIARNTVGRRPR